MPPALRRVDLRDQSISPRLRYQINTVYHISERDMDLNLDSKSTDEFAFANCYPTIIITIGLKIWTSYSDFCFIKLKLEGVSSNPTCYSKKQGVKIPRANTTTFNFENCLLGVQKKRKEKLYTSNNEKI